MRLSIIAVMSVIIMPAFVRGSDFEPLREKLHQQVSQSHREVLSYEAVRKLIFGRLHEQKTSKGIMIREVYCQKDYRVSNDIPDHKVVNVEHTWPESLFSDNFSKSQQKSDLHHLFPADSTVNRHRSSLEFGNVIVETHRLPCPFSRIGSSVKNETVFEPPQSHKGNVARAIFYFALRYKLSIVQNEEVVLRKWHAQDPVDQTEDDRNSMIERIQGNRNPFVDVPELVSRISDF